MASNQTPLDFYLWGHMESLVYMKQPQLREELVYFIQEAGKQIKNGRGMLKSDDFSAASCKKVSSLLF